MYATGGREFWMLAWVVDMASSVVTPSATRAGTWRTQLVRNYVQRLWLTALWSSQKDIQETETVMEQGTYTVTMKKDSWRANSSFTRKHEYVPGQLYWLGRIEDGKINSIALKLLETLDLSKVLS